MNEEYGNRIPAMVSHLVLSTIVVEALPDHATTNAPHIRWCRRLLMQVEEIAAEPAETALPVFDKSFWQQSYKIELTHFAYRLLAWEWVTHDPRDTESTMHHGGAHYDSPDAALQAAKQYMQNRAAQRFIR
jgi:hypothetical protein